MYRIANSARQRDAIESKAKEIIVLNHCGLLNCWRIHIEQVPECVENSGNLPGFLIRSLRLAIQRAEGWLRDRGHRRYKDEPA